MKRMFSLLVVAFLLSSCAAIEGGMRGYAIGGDREAFYMGVAAGLILERFSKPQKGHVYEPGAP